jgi:predicted O-linked N-acetylglucosamine transferase (SPINDLY family)
MNRPAEALVSFDRAVVGDPGHMLAWNNRGSALLSLRRYEDSVASFDRALALQPAHVMAWLGRAEALHALARHQDVLDSYERAIALRGEFDLALHGKARALFHLGRIEEAIAQADKLMRINPDYPYAQGDRAFWRLCACDWRGYEVDRAGIGTGIHAGKPVANPWVGIIVSDSAADQLSCARLWARATPASSVLPRQKPTRDKIRIAYLSADFRDHVSAHMTAGLFERHDRTRFETYGVSFGRNDQSPLRARLERAFDRFLDVAGVSDGAVADTLRREEIDIAIDLNGHTPDARPGILAARAAPLQVSYPGYPGTMGADFIDYLIADPMVTPHGAESWYSEKLVLLPDSYFSYACADDARVSPPSRRGAGLPEHGFVFSCFTKSYNLSAGMFDIWMRLLASVPDSVLWLLESNSAASANLRREAAARSIDAERLVFAPIAPIAEHRARHVLADLFLDTLPCNAHATAAEALWSGVPVLTCAGESFAARVAASLNQAAGMADLTTSSLAAYEGLALKLARDKAALAEIRGRLARNRETSPLFDAARLCRHLERAYGAMQDRYQAGAAPDTIVVRFDGA